MLSDVDSFSTLTEFAIAIAGFSGIAIALRGRTKVFDPLARFRHRNLILFSLSPAFGSTYPQTVSHFGAQGSDVWLWSSLFFSANCLYCLLVFAVPIFSNVTLYPEKRAQLSRTMWILSIGGTVASLVALLENALGFLGQPGPGPLWAGILWQIFIAALQFSRLLFTSSNSPAT